MRLTNQFRRLTAAAILALLPYAANAGAVITDFTPTHEPGSTPEALTHLTNKALVTEALDPGDTGRGKAVGFVLWRELLSAVSDQSGAGVILARPPEGQRLTELLRRDYHQAAVQIARSQKTWLALWAVVEVDDDLVFLHPYLSLLPEVRGAQPLLGVYARGRRTPLPGFTAELRRTQFGFRTRRMRLADLFARTVVTRRQASLHQAPDTGSAVVARVPAQTALSMRDMRDVWAEVETPDGVTGYLEMREDSPVDIPPAYVVGRQRSGNIRAAPSIAAERIDTRVIDGRFRVLDQRFVKERGKWLKWYRLDFDFGPAWIWAGLVDDRYSLPAIDFVAGMLRHGLSNYPQAAGHFRRYIETAGPDARNVNLATAYQFLGATTLIGKDANPPEALRAFDRAVDLTPYDPNAYALRAIANAGLTRRIDESLLDDLDKALSLDRLNPAARALLTAVDRVNENIGPVILQDTFPIRNRAALRRDLSDIRTRYGLRE